MARKKISMDGNTADCGAVVKACIVQSAQTFAVDPAKPPRITECRIGNSAVSADIGGDEIVTV